ncbi:MAG TPA: BTAD domain-containing putative transcriptional regulator, partial [Pseudonocardiaceae bacterium]|nr:BTAD domain-containing putative transcriptional regulator [Pseudonocardiaceae bacterium]
TLLRRALTPIPSITITWQSTGYRLTTDHNTIDLHRFRTLVDTARTADGPAAVATFEQAGALWRGEAFARLDLPWFNGLRTSLARERHAALLDLTDARLRSGQHAGLLAELSAQAREHPFDERIAGQLMLALYRGGRVADALGHYRRLAEHLAEELGTDPSPPLRELHQQILGTDPKLADPRRTVVASTTPGSTTSGSARGGPIPRQLPAAPRSFTGRATELAALSGVLDRAAGDGGTVVISAIAGAGGIGKTWLALYWAHQHHDGFPDGQLFVDLHGFSPDARPTPTATVVRGFLDALGVEPERIPAGLDAQAALWRTLVADKRMLLILDNAADTSQVLPLLPGGATATVLVTSRDHLNGLITGHGARHVPVDVLSDAEARTLLAARLGTARLTAEPDAVDELLASCGGFPLALSIVAGRAQVEKHLPLAALAAELADARLAALDDDDPAASLPAVLSWSFAALTTEQARVCWLLGLAPGPDIGLAAAAGLTGLAVEGTRNALRALERVSLLQQDRPGRWRMHDLIRDYAAEQGRRELPEASQDEALRRLAEFYLHTGYAGDRLLYPSRQPIELAAAQPGVRPYPLTDQTAALRWFEAEQHCVRAIQQTAAAHRWHHVVWQLAWILNTFYWRRGHLDEHLATWRIGLAATEFLHDSVQQGRAHQLLGFAYGRAGNRDEALAHLERALLLAEETGDRAGQASAHRTLGWEWSRRGQHPRALEHADRALGLYRDLGASDREPVMLNAVGWYAAQSGEFARAEAACTEALARHRALRDRDGEANALDSLAYIAHHVGEHEQAVSYYQHALALRRDLGDSYIEADTLDYLGHAYLALDRRDLARTVWEQALALFRIQHRTEEIERAVGQLRGLDQVPPA